MASYVELAASRGERVGQMFGKAADAILGVEDAEAAVERVLKNADWTTEEGKADMLAKVGAIDPKAHSELQKQMLEAEQTREATTNIKMNTENQLIAHKTKLNKGIYTRDWERLAGAGGMEFEIQYFLAQNEIDFDPEKVRTVAQAKAAIKKHMGKKSNYKSTQNQLDSFLGGRLEIYVGMRATQDASAELGVTIDTSTEPNKFDIPRGDTSGGAGGDGGDGGDKTNVPKDFNPLTTPEGPDFKAEKNGTMGTWTYVKDWIGGQDGYQVNEWKFIPDIGAEYVGEGIKYNIGGLPITSDEMFANFDY